MKVYIHGTLKLLTTITLGYIILCVILDYESYFQPSSVLQIFILVYCIFKIQRNNDKPKTGSPPNKLSR